MTQAWVVVGRCGEYSDRRVWVAAVHDAEAAAVAHAEALTEACAAFAAAWCRFDDDPDNCMCGWIIFDWDAEQFEAARPGVCDDLRRLGHKAQGEHYLHTGSVWRAEAIPRGESLPGCLVPGDGNVEAMR